MALGEKLSQAVAELALLARLLLAAVFLGAGAAKVRGWPRFRSAVADYQILPQQAVPAVAVVLPMAEISGGLLLASGVAIRWAAAALSILLAAFASAMAVNLRRGREIDCGCTATQTRPVTWARVVHNLALIGAAGLVTWAGSDASGFEPGRILPAVLTVATVTSAAVLARYTTMALRTAAR